MRGSTFSLCVWAGLVRRCAAACRLVVPDLQADPWAWKAHGGGLIMARAMIWPWLMLACAAALPGNALAATLHVDAALATGANDGSSWTNAFRDRLGLQSA